MRDLRQAIDIKAPITDVWDEITKLGTVQRAMMDTVLRTVLEVGAKLRYTSRDGSRSFIVGEFTEIDAPTRLQHTYSMTMRDDPDTLVTWSLEDLDGTTTRVTVTHTGWPSDTKGLEQIDSTWGGILSDLKLLLETGSISTGSRLKFAIMRRFHWALPKATKTPQGAV
ncbi:SRPBCC domain-containing protein [Euzebya tangerina]|uniref:SRPBCC domain-containing protein n=1 Tax=Euzebya tangerina TaxID=591198 RepID=UPI0013C32D85|nr:SRPBCC domain-containing protein [Euzebya tangerina]